MSPSWAEGPSAGLSRPLSPGRGLPPPLCGMAAFSQPLPLQHPALTLLPHPRRGRGEAVGRLGPAAQRNGAGAAGGQLPGGEGAPASPPALPALRGVLPEGSQWGLGHTPGQSLHAGVRGWVLAGGAPMVAKSLWGGEQPCGWGCVCCGGKGRTPTRCSLHSFRRGADVGRNGAEAEVLSSLPPEPGGGGRRGGLLAAGRYVGGGFPCVAQGGAGEAPPGRRSEQSWARQAVQSLCLCPGSHQTSSIKGVLKDGAATSEPRSPLRPESELPADVYLPGKGQRSPPGLGCCKPPGSLPPPPRPCEVYVCVWGGEWPSLPEPGVGLPCLPEPPSPGGSARRGSAWAHH